MAHLYVPPRVHQELVDERLQFEQCILNACSTDAVCEAANRELQRLDPQLRMVKAPEYLVVGMPLRPGYYHLVRDNEGKTFPTVTTVQGPNGEFREPGEWFLDKLRSLDLQNAAVVAAHRIEQRAMQQQAERDKANHRDGRRRDMRERWDAVSRTQVLMSDDIPWAQNHAGTKRPTRGTRRRDG